MRFTELDVVVLTVDRPDDGLRSGMRGTVLDVYKHDYEVEFAQADGETIFIGSVPPEQLTPYSKGTQA